MFPKPERLRLISINFTVIRGCGTVGMAVIPAIIADAPEQGFIVGGCALAVVATMAVLLGRRSAPPAIGPTGRVGAPAGAASVFVAYPSSRPYRDRKSTRLNSSHRCISYAVFCLKK